MALQAGDVFGRYELVSWLGRGGMAETWRAQLVGDAGVTKPVLIKKVLPEYANDEAFISMFISEARISATLSHGNVAQVFDFGRVDGEYFLAMEFVDGQPLHRVLKRAVKSGMSALPIPVAVFIAMEMCRGLHYAHTRTNGSGQPLGIVHRDISPDNVLLGYEGQVKIVDFGIAKAQLLRGFKTAPGVVKGKYLFFSPEQARGEDVDARTDVWATGVVLYELLCGKLPVAGAPHVVMMRLGRGEIPAPSVLRPDLPQELNDIVMRALTPDRELRFESSHAFGDALAGFLYSNFPRFSSMSIAHLVRVLFRGDLVQEGRELSVPGSFLEEMKSWREPTPLPEPAPPPQPMSERQTRRLKAVSPPVPTETTEPHALEPSSGASRRLIYGLSAGGLLTVGACLWFLILQEPHPSQIESAAPPPRPILPSVKVEPPAETKVAEPFPARPPPLEEKTVVAKASPQAPPMYLQDVQGEVRLALREKEYDKAQELANDCMKRYPQTPECHLMLGVVYAVLKDFNKSQNHYTRFLALTEDGYPKRDLVIKALSRLADEGRAADTSPPQYPSGSPPEASANLRQQADELTTKQKYVAALAKAERCIQADPTFADCEFSLGYIHSKLGNAQQSEQHYERFLTLAPIDHPKRARVINILGSTKKTSR